jgi:hypothetical protein
MGMGLHPYNSGLGMMGGIGMGVGIEERKARVWDGVRREMDALKGFRDPVEEGVRRVWRRRRRREMGQARSNANSHIALNGVGGANGATHKSKLSAVSLKSTAGAKLAHTASQPPTDIDSSATEHPPPLTEDPAITPRGRAEGVSRPQSISSRRAVRFEGVDTESEVEGGETGKINGGVGGKGPRLEDELEALLRRMWEGGEGEGGEE